MSRPRIGITVDRQENSDNYESPMAYATTVEKAGGLPLLIPYRLDGKLAGEVVDLFDGFLFTGGDDLDPALFGQPRHPRAEPVDPARQVFELALLAEVERRRAPVLGICMGSQLMNVYRGGSLHQFIPDVPRESMLEHRKAKRDDPSHSVIVDPASQLGRAIGKPEITVNTYHKQAADRVGRGLRVVATSPDGIIEGFEDPAFPLFAAVQWHPEKIHEKPEQLNLFRLLVDTARTREITSR